MHVTLEEMAREALASRSKKDGGAGLSTALQPFRLLPTDIPVPEQIQAIGEACGVAADCVENAYPCTPLQESLVSVTEGNENRSLRQLVYKLSGDISLDRFQQAWDGTIRANPVLRTRICQLEGQLRFLQAVIDQDLLWNTTTTNLDRFLKEDANNLMKLGGRFFRYALILDNGQRYFVWTVHHALCDGASLLEILSDVSSRLQNEPITQRAPFEQFIESTTVKDSSKEREFWERTLSGLDVTAFPPLPQTTNFHASPSSTVEGPITLTERAPFGLTKALFLRAAWGILMSHHTGTENIVFGAINNG